MKKRFKSLLFFSFFGIFSAYAFQLEPIEEIFEPIGTFDPSRYGKVAVVAWAPSETTPLGVTVEEAESFKQRQRETLAEFVKKAAESGAKMVITPEFATVGYPDIPELPSEDDQFQTREDLKPYVETIPGPTTNYFGAIAKELGIYIHVGFAEVDPVTDLYYNTVTAIDPSGQVVASYRKMNMYSVEKNFLAAGKTPVVYESPFGKVGITICSDIYSSSPMNEYAKMGIQVNALSTSWAQWNSGMHSFRRGAVRTKSYVLASNQTYFPDSGVVNPDGTNQSHIRQSTGIAYGYLPYVLPTPTEPSPTPAVRN